MPCLRTNVRVWPSDLQSPKHSLEGLCESATAEAHMVAHQAPPAISRRGLSANSVLPASIGHGTATVALFLDMSSLHDAPMSVEHYPFRGALSLFLVITVAGLTMVFFPLFQKPAFHVTIPRSALNSGPRLTLWFGLW